MNHPQKTSSIVWQPKDICKTHLARFMKKYAPKIVESSTQYADLHQWSIDHPIAFWSAIVEYFNITFTNPPTQILNTYQHPLEARWFTGATLNFAAHLLRRYDDHPALISYLEQGQRQVYSYRALHHAVAACIQGLRTAGIQAGDRVAAIMPNVPETIIAMLATTAIGAIWASCSPDFGADALIDRFAQITPTLLFAAPTHHYNGKIFNNIKKINTIQSAIPSLRYTVFCPVYSTREEISAIDTTSARTQPNTHTLLWTHFIHPVDTATAASPCTFIPMPFDHPLYIVFSSGTTGQPKCIVHGAGGTLLQHSKELGLHTDIQAHDNLCFLTTCGWMMWNWMVSALHLGATITLYDGSPTYPDPTRILRLLATERVTVWGTSAKFLSSLEKSLPPHPLSATLPALRTLLSTGSPLLAPQYDFIHRSIKPSLQISSISGGTDILSCFALGNPLLPVYRGEIQCLGLGMAVAIFDETGHPLHEQRGELVCTNAFPAMPLYFWNDPHQEKYYHAYYDRFPGIWTHGDYAEITAHGGLIIYGRSDSVLNPGGVRIGTADIYRPLAHIPSIIDSVVVGQEWDNDIRIILFVQLMPGVPLTPALIHTIQDTIRTHASPRHVPHYVIAVPDIPKTRNGKTMERAVRQVIHHQPVDNMTSLANPEALQFFQNLPLLHNHGFS